MAAALKRFQEASAAEVELDLRGNLGGLVSQGVETARLFLDGAFSSHPFSQSLNAVDPAPALDPLHQ